MLELKQIYAPEEIRIFIKNNYTGEEREYKKHDLAWYEHSQFTWEEGNFACDCNRAIFFAREDEDDEEQCGHEKYAVRIETNDGKVIYED